MDPNSRNVIEYIDRNKSRILDFLCEFVSKKSINHGTPGTGDELEAQEFSKGLGHVVIPGEEHVDINRDYQKTRVKRRERIKNHAPMFFGSS